MSIPMRIASHNRELSEASKAEIEQYVSGLETFYPRIVGCEVHIEGPGGGRRRGGHCVRIILSVPTRRIVISRRKADSLREALGAAFRAAGRRLEDHARKIRGDVKRHGSAVGENS